MDLVASCRRGADHRSLRRADRSARAGGHHAAPARRARGRDGVAATSGDAVARVRSTRCNPMCSSKTANGPTSRAGISRRSGRPVTRPDTCVSGSRAISSCSRVTMCCLASPRTFRFTRKRVTTRSGFPRVARQVGELRSRRSAAGTRTPLRRIAGTSRRVASTPSASLRGDRRRYRRWRHHRMGNRRTNALVALMGPHRRIHAARRGCRGDGAPAYTRTSRHTPRDGRRTLFMGLRPQRPRASRTATHLDHPHAHRHWHPHPFTRAPRASPRVKATRRQEDSTMDDEEILKRIRTMVDEEHGLRRSGEMVDDSRMRQLEETLDQCWDLTAPASRAPGVRRRRRRFSSARHRDRRAL